MKICVPIKEKSQTLVLKRLKEASKKAELAEIWLDQISDLDLSGLLKQAELPLVCVCKKPVEKGEFKGTYAQLADILIRAAEGGAAYVDIPSSMPQYLIRDIQSIIKQAGCKGIISYHNFEGAPPLNKLIQKAESIRKKGADVVKIATRADSLEDTVNLIMLAKTLQERKMPHILIAMGKKGILSRVLTPTLGGEMMFATLEDSKKTAPGQMTVKELREAWQLIK
jgi:3-dehydroquinate dehydratase/shikimate dehydrogenase